MEQHRDSNHVANTRGSNQAQLDLERSKPVQIAFVALGIEASGGM